MTAVTDRTPSLADLADDHWSEQDMQSWLWQLAHPDTSSDDDETDDGDEMPVDDYGPEITCQPNLFRFCRYCGRDMDTSSSNERSRQ